MKNLDNTTLCIIDCKYHKESAKSIIYCSSMCDFKFAKKIFISDIYQDILKKYNINYINIEKIKSKREYDFFVIKKLSSLIDTDYLLIIQHDGVIYNTSAWNDNFFKFDYIGAPWPKSPKNINNVGNGGFSLRSKKLMDKVSVSFKEDFCLEPEDVTISETMYHEMIENNFKYADCITASNFSSELKCSFSNEESFGFHLAGMDHLVNKTHQSFLKFLYNEMENKI